MDLYQNLTVQDFIYVNAEAYKPGMEDGFKSISENECYRCKKACFECDLYKPFILNKNGTTFVKQGDYIARTIPGEKFVMEAEFFHRNYRQITNRGVQVEAVKDGNIFNVDITINEIILLELLERLERLEKRIFKNLSSTYHLKEASVLRDLIKVIFLSLQEEIQEQ